MRRRRPKSTLHLSTDDIQTLMALVARHVKPEQYKEGSDVRELIEASIRGDEGAYTHYTVS